MTAASDGGAQRRTTGAAGAQARQRRHRQCIAHSQLDFFDAAAPADALLAGKRRVRLVQGCARKRLAADGIGYEP
jgi:hypothetical protein